MLRLIVIFSILIYLCNSKNVTKLSFDPKEVKIVGGVEVSITELPYQVAVLKDLSTWCGGSIIKANVIISAAHCITDDDLAFSIRAGSSNVNEGGQVVQVKKAYIHENYNRKTAENDICLLELVQPLILGKGVAIISLPYYGQYIEEGTFSVVSGWGKTSQSGSESLKLLKVYLPIVRPDICENIYSTYYRKVTDDMICAGFLDSGGKDACQGDSGGPLAVNGVLIGITSWGSGCAQPGYPGVWTKVPNYVYWIRKLLSIIG